MAQVLSPQTTESPQSPAVATMSPVSLSSPSTHNPNFSSLPPLVTSPPPRSTSQQSVGLQRVPSHQYKQRLSTYSVRSNTSASNNSLFPAGGSRPQSVAFPQFHSSLPYALVRDFAYPPYHLLHYGAPPERESGLSTPASEAQNRRLSDPIPTWSGQKLQRDSGQQQAWSSTGDYLPNTSFGDGDDYHRDGPPYSEDEDLASPVVTSSRHRKNRSNPASLTYHGMNGDASQTHYGVSARDGANGVSGEFGAYSEAPAETTADGLSVPTRERRRDSHFAQMLPNRSYDHAGFDMMASSPDSPSDDSDFIDVDENRYSRDYQFTIASPDEEMHGRAVALFDFAQENENELPLVEGQVVLISYRHGQGWLVAQDPKTGDTGLVPEEYVRLLRDIEGGLHGLMTNGAGGAPPVDDDTPTDSSAEAKTPTQLEHHHGPPFADQHPATKKDEYYAPVVSTFSTSREDLEPWPHHLLGSQVTTPTLPKESYSPTRRGSTERAAGSRSRSPAKRQETKDES
ncbi:uncharacterized protein PV09_08733 [Verruconis gallopava]|uniref:SH3 domain-containing protein n=1 Tax=Verruconis gallopava TaxID=253628 RepID=A0A0D1XBT1_9PEZI|nr:uncharacterized protein PV09_08733 [Verruconis gallopava]KIV99680.1 hypothetical protein PV09_08733 [Verruconis gallopava]